MAECSACKWWVGFDTKCLLGRDPANCSGNPARRGDDELVERVVDLPDEELSDVRRRIKKVHDEVREISFHKKDEWE